MINAALKLRLKAAGVTQTTPKLQDIIMAYGGSIDNLTFDNGVWTATKGKLSATGADTEEATANLFLLAVGK